VHFLENFIYNDDYITKHNSQPGVTYKLAHNQFSHMSVEEWRAHIRLGLAKKDENVKGERVHEPPTDFNSLPTSIDWVELGAVTDVKDQGQCGSCWSFSTTGALEGAYKIKYGSLVSFSEQNLVDCDNFIHQGTDMACNGGLMDHAFGWVKSNGGLCTEADYPYVSGETQKSGFCKQSSCTIDSKVAPTSYTDVTPNSDAAMMSALAQQPVAVAIEADQTDFQLYSSGVFTASCGTNLDHGVLVVGYGNLLGTDYYKVKNSWGPSWGLDGYILLERGISQKEGQCGVLSSPSYPNL
jgi:C1A family cysteine protease